MNLPSVGKGSYQVHLPSRLGGTKHVQKKTVILVGGTFFIAVVTIVVLYATNPSFKDSLNKLLHIKGKIMPAVITAPNVKFDLIPDEVRPNSYFQIVGSFQDLEGKDVTVIQGFFYVFRTDSLANTTGRELVLQGTLGQNISSFNQTVPTPGLADGNYEVTITDTPLSVDEIGNLHSGQGPYGAGKTFGTPASAPAVNSLPGITIS